MNVTSECMHTCTANKIMKYPYTATAAVAHTVTPAGGGWARAGAPAGWVGEGARPRPASPPVAHAVSGLRAARGRRAQRATREALSRRTCWSKRLYQIRLRADAAQSCNGVCSCLTRAAWLRVGGGAGGEGSAPSDGGWRRVVASAAMAHTVTPVGGGWARAGAPGRRGGARPASLSIRHRAHALCW